MPQAPLASKDGSLFRQVLKCYETKQYKKGLKAAEQILRKNPKHGETLAMKGLITNSLGRTEEAFAIAKEALRHDMKSHVCWHVYGLLYRSEKNFEESIKAYKMALRFEPESQQILRDLALLQVQMRDYPGYVESRGKILQGRPQLRQNWTGLAVAYHLAGSYAEAENVLKKYEETLKNPPSKGDIEHSEACLYRNVVIAESGDIARALEHLESIAKVSLDKISVMEYRADYLLRLDRKEEAEKAYRALLERNSEKRQYYNGLEQSIGIDPEDRKPMKAIYDEFAEKNPRSDAPRRIPLDFLEGEDFKQAADVYLQKLLKKGVPSTFANIKALYAGTAKRETILELVEGYLASMGTEEAPTNGETNGNKPKPSDFKLWTLYFLTQHYDHYRTRNTTKASEYLNRALELSPGTVELHMTQARIYKHSGDLQKAMEKMNQARELDTKDRYINTKCAKYQLRNDRNEDALKTMSLFTRFLTKRNGVKNDAHGGPLGDLLEMQCVWFITEDGESYLRQGNLGLALKRFHAMLKIFDDWTEDQFDFHSFSLRKGQIRAYVTMLRWEDTLRSHPFFVRAALGAIKVYTMLHDRPHLAHSLLSNGNGEGPDFEGMSPADRKKALKKAKREQQKAQDKAAELAAKAKEDKAKNAQVASADGEMKKEDTDPLGISLAQTKEPLEVAMKFLTPLLELSSKRVEVQCAGFDVYLRRKKWLLALKCLIAAREIEKENPVVHEQTIRFRRAVDSLAEEDVKEPSREVLTAELETILPKETDLKSYNEEFLNSHKDSPQHVRGALRARHLLSPEDANIAGELANTLSLAHLSLKEAIEGQTLLKDLKADNKDYNQKASEKFPDAAAFQTAA
ncbi:N-terminal acetyltransferase A, auxiliary subunit [Choiromyces venosus 120613-1]|uniref:N-terminal acetyltransferase A, auxiliary subunit n=1 Tax=Choiromyces venosus 120613-1 TaxID=1336337 RepID=A0A3N4JP76_9PEZI|nr:N-terminal acetyltransferase A, auxiliary subunit [Choiromyces venosus 120613-1]